jgi:hypothetical protein
MGKLFVEAEIIAIEKKADGYAIIFQSDRQVKAFAINLEGDDGKLKVGDQVTLEISIKEESKSKKKKKASSNGNTEV